MNILTLVSLVVTGSRRMVVGDQKGQSDKTNYTSLDWGAMYSAVGIWKGHYPDLVPYANHKRNLSYVEYLDAKGRSFRGWGSHYIYMDLPLRRRRAEGVFTRLKDAVFSHSAKKEEYHKPLLLLLQSLWEVSEKSSGVVLPLPPVSGLDAAVSRIGPLLAEAGFKKIRYISDPLAVALSYLTLMREKLHRLHHHSCMVINIGAAFTSAGIFTVRLNEGSCILQMVKTSGVRMGTADLMHAVLQDVYQQAKKSSSNPKALTEVNQSYSRYFRLLRLFEPVFQNFLYGADLAVEAFSMELLEIPGADESDELPTYPCERLEEYLSTQARSPVVNIPGVAGLVQELLEKSASYLNKEGYPILRVLLAGGGGGLHGLKDRLEALLKNLESVQSILAKSCAVVLITEPYLCCIRGATLYSALLNREADLALDISDDPDFMEAVGP